MTQTRDVQAMSLRLPKELYEAVRTCAFATDTSINDLVIRSVQQYLADQSRQSEVTSYLKEAREQYRVALDKLADL